MSFIASLLQVPSFISSLGKSLAMNPTVRHIESYLPEIVMAIMFKQAVIEIGGYTVTAKTSGAPVAFTLSAGFLALEQVIAGSEGQFKCGVIEIDVVKMIAPTVTPVAVI